MYKGMNSKLAYLMDAMGVTGKELSKVLHVDYTLISKWRNNSRQLTVRSSYLEKVAAYFLSLDDAQHSIIRQLLEESYGNADESSSEALLQQFALWLCDPRPQQVADSQTIIPDRANYRYTAKFDAYYGDKGRRTAVLRFMDCVLALPPGQRLLLHSQEDMAWLLEDTGFLRTWREKLTQVIQRGDHITIIHTVDRDAKDIAPIVSHWLPLHLSGRIQSYFQPQYIDTPGKSTCFLLQDTAVITGTAISGGKTPRYTAYFTDPDTLANQQAMFAALLAQCRPLLTAFPTSPSGSVLERFLEASQRPYDTILFSPTPTIATMPEETLREVLRANHVREEGAQACLRLHQATYVAVASARPNCRIRHLYDLAATEQLMLQGESLVDPYLSLLAEKEVHVSRHQLKSHLQHIVFLLNNVSNYEVGLVSRTDTSTLRGITVWIKENELVGASTPVPQKHGHFAVLAEEPTVVNSFYHYFTDLWHAIPRVDRSKPGVVARLTRMAESL